MKKLMTLALITLTLTSFGQDTFNYPFNKKKTYSVGLTMGFNNDIYWGIGMNCNTSKGTWFMSLNYLNSCELETLAGSRFKEGGIEDTKEYSSRYKTNTNILYFEGLIPVARNFSFGPSIGIWKGTADKTVTYNSPEKSGEDFSTSTYKGLLYGMSVAYFSNGGNFGIIAGCNSVSMKVGMTVKF